MLEAIIGLIAAAPSWLTTLAWAVGAAALIYFKGRNDGKGVERSRQSEENSAARSVADEIDAAVAGRDVETNRERLSKWSK
ncbi:hypothetical protein [Brucella sp. 2280]|uniref:hypothetical protein n=1 Tax=Brucella sp. 2280 TaxID=2592625 RepID=UPI001296AE73|nr:hypothetical protein [Brucella sp. 2280]QGA58123.1 hypothetical protein GHC20_13720 [Brucella sp. 2280]